MLHRDLPPHTVDSDVGAMLKLFSQTQTRSVFLPQILGGEGKQRQEEAQLFGSGMLARKAA